MILRARGRLGEELACQALAQRGYEIGPIFITPVQIVIIVVSVVTMACVYVLMNRTKLGKAIRAGVESSDEARLVRAAVGRFTDQPLPAGAWQRLRRARYCGSAPCWPPKR